MINWKDNLKKYNKILINKNNGLFNNSKNTKRLSNKSNLRLKLKLIVKLGTSILLFR